MAVILIMHPTYTDRYPSYEWWCNHHLFNKSGPVALYLYADANYELYRKPSINNNYGVT